MEKVVVLGSNSFSGSHMVNYLLEKTDYDVIGISRSEEYKSIFLPYLYKRKKSDRFKFYQYDINQNLDEIISLLDKEEPEFILNYAAQGEVRNSWKWPEQWYDTNCMSFVKLTNALKEKKYIKRFVQASTPEVYGACGGMVSESCNYQPSTPYASSKAAADLFLNALSRSYNFPVTLTRAANVYGIHQQLYRIIPRTIIYLKLGKKIQLHGGGHAKRAFIHIRDNCDNVLKIMQAKDPSFVYHISPDDGLHSIRDIVRYICEKMNYDFDENTEDVGKPIGQDSVYELDSTLAKRELGWKPSISFEEGVNETIQWIEENWDEIKEQPLDYIHKK